MVKNIARLWVLFLLASCGRDMDPPGALFVAPGGNDGNPGTKARPFATVLRARDEVRKIRASQKLPVTIYLRGGVYRVDRMIEFAPEDSGSQGAPITYRAFGRERPILSGGRPISGWKRGEAGIWQAELPDVKAGRWRFHQLFVNGERRTCARTPNEGYLYTEGILAPFNRAKWSDPNIVAKRGFIYRPGDIRRWHNFQDARIVIYHSWTTSIHLIEGLDEDARKVTVAPISRWPIGYWWEWNTRYHVENIPEALDAPGEWYLDRATGILSYLPMPGEDMRRAEVIAPAIARTLIAFKGVPAEKKYIEHLRFEGISFQHTDCHIAPDMPPDEQGAIERFPMIEALGLRHSTFERCEIAHAGENGIWLDSGSADNALRRCHIHDLAGSAVFIGPRKWQDKPEMRVERNVVDNCFIHDGSHIFRGSQGVWIGRSSFNQITHNEISDFHHLGISIGHSWGYAPSSANNNLIAFNHVHHICNGYFSDGGGIYTLGISPGTIIRNNVVHDIMPTPMMPVGGTGIYHDEGSTGIRVESNIVYRVGAGAYNQHYGRENIARNNIFAFGGSNTITCCRAEDHLSFTFEGNIVLSEKGQATSDHFSPLKCKTEFRRNLYWDISGREPVFSGVSFSEWQKTGRDADSKIADPRFHDPQRGDFRLGSDSPALAMGFKPIDANLAGLYGDREWTSAPRRIRRPPLPVSGPLPPEPPPKPLVEDFEAAPVGRQPDGYQCHPANRHDVMQVVEGTSRDGKKSLRFAEAEGLPHAWEPHLFYTTRPLTNGVVRFQCDVLNDATRPSECFIGLRDYTQKGFEYREGVSIALRADGTVAAGGKVLTKIQPGKWIHIDILLALDAPIAHGANVREGQKPNPVGYSLAVTPDGGQEQRFDRVPCLHSEFRQVTWLGFSSSGKPGAVFHVDNIRLESVKETR